MTTNSKYNFDNAREAIESTFKTEWSETEIAFQDVPYLVDQDEFIALNVLWSGSNGVGLQVDGPIRDWGLVFMEVFARPNNGSERILSVCGMAREVFNERVLVNDSLHFQSGTIRRVGVMGDFLKYIVEIPFFYQG